MSDLYPKPVVAAETDYPVFEDATGRKSSVKPNDYAAQLMSPTTAPYPAPAHLPGANPIPAHVARPHAAPTFVPAPYGAPAQAPAAGGARPSNPFVTTPLQQEVSDEAFGLKSQRVRLNFIRKVAGILAVQFVITAALICVSVVYPSYEQFVQENQWLYGLAFITFMVTLYGLGCYKSVARSVPINYIFLFLFTAAEAYMVSILTSLYEPHSVVAAAVLTAAMVLGVAVYALTTKTDFTMCGGLLFVAGIVLLLASIMVGAFNSFFHLTLLSTMLSVASVMLFAVYLIFDIQLLTGERSAQFEVDDYIQAALFIYIDIMRIFIEILRIVGQAKR